MNTQQPTPMIRDRIRHTRLATNNNVTIAHAHTLIYQHGISRITCSKLARTQEKNLIAQFLKLYAIQQRSNRGQAFFRGISRKLLKPRLPTSALSPVFYNAHH